MGLFVVDRLASGVVLAAGEAEPVFFEGVCASAAKMATSETIKAAVEIFLLELINNEIVSFIASLGPVKSIGRALFSGTALIY